MVLEPEQFKSFERAGWDNIPAAYHQAFAELTTQAINSLLDAARVKRGSNFLDIACGPGYVAAAAAKRGATVLGVDFSEPMIAQARQLYPGIEFREGDAEELPFGNGLFEAAAMNFGILHLGRPHASITEAYRVLRSGGRFAFSVWAPPQETIGFGAVLRAVEQHGEPRVELPQGPPFFRYSEPRECKDGLIAAGFESPKVIKIAQTWRLADVDALFDAMWSSTVRTAGLLRAQKPTVLGKIREAMQADLKKYTKKGVVELPMPALIASGVKR